MKRIVTILFVLGLGLAAGGLMADEISIQAPTPGKEYAVGSTLTIRWQSWFMEWLPQTAEQRKMAIKLWVYDAASQGHPISGAFPLEIATVDVESGHFDWRVQDLVSPWNQGFYFELSMVHKPSILVGSPPFTITKRRLAVRPPVTASAALLHSIEVYSPAAGQNCYIGSTVTIRWKKDRIAGYGQVWVQVCWPDHSTAAGAFPTANTGSLDWPIKETQENTLCVKVFTPDDKFVGYSKSFYIKKSNGP